MFTKISSSSRLVNLIPYAIIGVGFMVVALMNINGTRQTERNRQQGLVGQTYTRATNCFQAVPAAQRTQEYIHSCYDRAEEATGKKVERYGN